LERITRRRGLEKMESEISLYCSDFRKLIPGQIPDDSVDLIFTDPPYLRKFVPLYGDLGKFASRVLRPGGSLVCYIGHYNLPDYLSLLAPHLNYWWIFSVGLQTPGFPMNHRRVVPTYKPLLWYVKGQYLGEYVYDHIDSRFQGKKHHKWQQSTTEAHHFIERLTEEGDTVLDPCAGSGTTGLAAFQLKRKFVGVDVDPVAFATMQKRLYRELEKPVLVQKKLF
jgi:DNA modification methylase